MYYSAATYNICTLNKSSSKGFAAMHSVKGRKERLKDCLPAPAEVTEKREEESLQSDII